MCLEEMFSTAVSEGHSIMGKQSAGKKIEFTDDLRLQVKNSFEEMHQLYQKGYTPRVKWSKKLQCMFFEGHLHTQTWKSCFGSYIYP